MTALPLTSLATLLILILLSFTAFNVGRARGRYGVKAPAVTGHEMFERAFRVQMNTLEGVVLMLPALWLYGAFIDDRGAGLMGLIWLVARAWYALAYQRDPATRGGGFLLGMLMFSGLWLGAFWGVMRMLLG
jgi:glutathione S-transferase